MGGPWGEDEDYFMCLECQAVRPQDRNEGGGVCSECMREINDEQDQERASDHKREERA